MARLDPVLLRAFARPLAELAPAFTVGGCEAALVEALAAAAPGVAKGFDPLLLYERDRLPSDPRAFRGLGETTFAAMPDAAIFYLEARLVLASADHGVVLPRLVNGAGAVVDTWTIDADSPDLARTLEELARLGCDQIPSNDPLELRAIWEAPRRAAS